jgi:hypothetical protein
MAEIIGPFPWAWRIIMSYAVGGGMSRSGYDPDARLEESLRRIRSALDYSRNHYAAMIEQIMVATSVDVAERVSAKIAARHQRTMHRLETRRERRARRWLGHQGRDMADLPRGVVTAVAALVCLVLAVRTPGLWWLVFVALGLGSTAARIFGRAAWSRRLELGEQAGEREPAGSAEPGAAGVREPRQATQAVPAEPSDPRVTRIQSLCDKLLAEVESGPPIVRELVTEPQTTIGGLRQACLEIARRERELNSVLAAQQEATLVADRDALTARLSNERDEIVRDRLGQALRALEEQLAHRAELTIAASRLEAENTRILYTLESLHMQLLRARSTDIGAPELGGKLRESLRELGTQIDAVAEALEFASTPAGTGPGGATEASPVATPAATDAAQAERQAAAMRAAQAAQANRR